MFLIKDKKYITPISRIASTDNEDSSIYEDEREYITPIERDKPSSIKRFNKNQGVKPIKRCNIPSFSNEVDLNRDNYLLNNYYLSHNNGVNLTLEENELSQKIYIGEVLEVIREGYTKFNYRSRGIEKHRTNLKEFKEEYEAIGLTTKQVSIYRKYYKLYKILGDEYFDFINERIGERAVCLFTKDGINETFIREVFEGYARGSIKSLSKVEELIYTRPDSFYNKKEQLDSLLTMIKNGFTKRSYEDQEDLIEDIYKLLKGKKKSKKCKL